MSRRARSGPAVLRTPMPPKQRMLPALALIFSPQTQPASRAKIWCTGKDSNLRTSQGGADLQSAGFNHSPTCALAVSVEQRALSNHLPLAHSSQLEALSDTPQPLLRLHLATWGSESARENLPALTTHLENSLMVCRWKSCLPPALLNFLRDVRSFALAQDFGCGLPIRLLRRLTHARNTPQSGAGEGI